MAKNKYAYMLIPTLLKVYRMIVEWGNDCSVTVRSHFIKRCDAEFKTIVPRPYLYKILYEKHIMSFFMSILRN